MKTIVIYKTVTGFTEKYANWIAEELNADILSYENTKIENLLNYDQIIFGGPVYASRINGFDLIQKNFSRLQDKKIIAFACGAGSYHDGLIGEIQRNLGLGENNNKVKVFYLRGGFNFNKLPVKFRAAMTVYKWTLQAKKEKDAETLAFLKAFHEPTDFTDKNNVKELVEYAR